jgi:hypothetical protein
MNLFIKHFLQGVEFTIRRRCRRVAARATTPVSDGMIAMSAVSAMAGWAAGI